MNVGNSIKQALAAGRLFEKGPKQIVGHVDAFRENAIAGWAAAVGVESPVEVVAISEGRRLGRTRADMLRRDLIDAGHGVGKHGFVLKLPENKSLEEGRFINVFESETMTELVGSPVFQPSSTAPEYVFDLSDLFFFLVHHDNPSGIQRVQISVVSHLLTEPSEHVSLKFVYYESETNQFRILDARRVGELLGDLKRPKSKRTFPTGGGQVDLLASALGAHGPLQANKGTILILLGAAWVFPEYFMALRGIQSAGGRFCCLLHDLIPIEMPSLCDKGTAEVFKFFIRRVVHYADGIMCVSEWTKKDLTEYAARLNKELPPIVVVNNGSDISQYVPEPSAVEATRYDEKEFVLYVSTIEGRKNHDLLLATWQRLRGELGDRTPQLRLVGRLGWRVESFIEALYATNFLDGLVRIESEVSDEQLAYLYGKCLFTVYPSKYEGWGLPVGESLGFGKVCVASSATAIPEAARGCAILVNPDDVEGFYAEVRRLIEDRAYLQKTEKKLREAYTPYTWREITERVLECCKQSLSAPPRFPSTLKLGEEWTFRRLDYLTTNTLHGDEVIAHLHRFSRPALLRTSLSLDNYIVSELATDGIGWYPREDWGRWTNRKLGAKFEFILPTDSPVVAFFKIKVPDFSPGDEVVVEGRFGQREFFEMAAPERLITFSVEPYTINRTALFTLKYIPADGKAGGSKDPQSRSRGVGVSAAVLLDANDVLHRLEVLEQAMNTVSLSAKLDYLAEDRSDGE
jgi:glycosyltransferase involved in cell wall biosynthesis